MLLSTLIFCGGVLGLALGAPVRVAVMTPIGGGRIVSWIWFALLIRRMRLQLVKRFDYQLLWD